MTINEVINLFPEYKESELIISGYDTQSNIANANLTRYFGCDFSVLFYCGELTYISSEGFGDIDLVDGQLRYSLGVTQFGKSKSSYWIITIYEKKKHNEYHKEIEGIISTIYGKDFLNKKIFTQECYRDQSTFSTPAFLNPYYRVTENITEEKIRYMNVFEQWLYRLDENEMASIIRSMAWLSEASKTYGSDSFLRMWIALEIGFTKTDNTVKELREKIARANDIVNEKVDAIFCLGKMYGVRKEIVHRGKNPPIDGSILDIMYYLFTDLLYFKLAGQKYKKALGYIKEKQINLNAILSKCFV